MLDRARMLAFAFAAALALPVAPAGASNWFEMNFYMSGPEYQGKLPPCDYRDALVRIASRFNQKENMYWATALRILHSLQIRAPSSRPCRPRRLPRRDSTGTGRSSDRRRYPTPS